MTDPTPQTPPRPWHLGAATGLGSLPGTDPGEAARMVAGELPDLPYLAELPARGVGADLVGRTIALLVDVYADVVPSGWRTSRRPGADTRRAKDFLAWDLDAAEQHYAGAEFVKVQICGPWTLASRLETSTGHRALTDHGAVDELTESLAEGLVQHLNDLRRRLPDAEFVVQIDEPDLPAVLAGTLPTASGFGTVRAVGRQRAGEMMARLVETAAAVTIAQCSHLDVPLRLFQESGFSAIATDFTLISTNSGALDVLGELVESGLVIVAGIIPSFEPPAGRIEPAGNFDDRSEPYRGPRGYGLRNPNPNLRQWALPLTDSFSKLGFSALTLAEQVVVSPTGGLADTTAQWAKRAMTLSHEVARLLGEPLI